MIHIQTSAPGPPVAIATAIPEMFPVPKFPAKTVESAAKRLILPLLSKLGEINF